MINDPPLRVDLTDPEGDDITVDGTIKLCSDLGVDPEDVVLLAVAYELKAPRLAEWTKKGWTEGWKNVGCVIQSLCLSVLTEELTHWRGLELILYRA